MLPLPPMPHVLFTPWVGPNYETAEILGRRRMLIMGESHYAWPDAPKNKSTWTQYCVREGIEGRPYNHFWPGIEKTLLGGAPSSEERARFWNAVAFYNYVQESVGDGPDKKVTFSMLTDAQPGFLEVLDALRPRTLLVFSRKCWTWMPPEDETGPEISLNGTKIGTARYKLGDGEWTSAYCLRHTSRGFSSTAWRAALLQALADVE